MALSPAKPTSPSPLAGILATVAALLPAGAALSLATAWRDRLPNTLPSHWSGAGPADGFSDTATMTLISVGISVVAGVAAAVIVWLPVARTAGGWPKRWLVGGLAAASAMSAFMWGASAWLVLDHGDPAQAVLGWGGALAFVVIGYGAIPALLLPAPGTPALLLDPAHELTPERPLEIPDAGTLAWSRTVTSGLFLGFSVLMVGFAILMWALAARGAELSVQLLTLLPGLVAALVMLALARIRVSADWRGLRVVTWIGAIPLKRIPLEHITDATATQLLPGEWGGWGYRVLPGRSAYITGRGPGLVVTRTSGTLFAVSLSAPEEAAELLRRLSGVPAGDSGVAVNSDPPRAEHDAEMK